MRDLQFCGARSGKTVALCDAFHSLRAGIEEPLAVN
jgi:hypothetical protein